MRTSIVVGLFVVLGLCATVAAVILGAELAGGDPVAMLTRFPGETRELCHPKELLAIDRESENRLGLLMVCTPAKTEHEKHRYRSIDVTTQQVIGWRGSATLTLLRSPNGGVYGQLIYGPGDQAGAQLTAPTAPVFGSVNL